MTLERAKSLVAERAKLALQSRNASLQVKCSEIQNDMVRRGMSISSVAANLVAKACGEEALESEAELVRCLEHVCRAFGDFITPDSFAEIQEILLGILDARFTELNAILSNNPMYKGGSTHGDLKSEFVKRIEHARESLPSNVEIVLQSVQRSVRGEAATATRSDATEVAAFISANSPFDAFAAVAKVVSEANIDLLIVDPYLDHVALTDYAACAAKGVKIRLLGDMADTKPSLLPAAKAWRKQHNLERPLEVRFAPAKMLHDRLIIVDKMKPWILTQSLKDLAKRSPADLALLLATAEQKIAAYEAFWAAAATQDLL